MLLSIVVPTYNVEQFIGNCIESLLMQDISKEEYEILVINDGSTDESGKIASTFADKNKNVILVNQENEQIGTMPKMEAHEKAILHRAFSVFIIVLFIYNLI